MEEKLKLKEIALIYLYVIQCSMNNEEKTRRVKINFVKSAKKENIAPCLIEGREHYYSQKDIMKVFSKSHSVYSSLKEMPWEEVLEILEKAKNIKEKENKKVHLEKDKKTPSRWHHEFKRNIEEVVVKGESLDSFLSTYYKDLCDKIKNNMNLHTSISVFMKHRNTLKEFSKEKSPYQKKFKDSLFSFQIPPYLLKEYQLRQLKGVRKKLQTQKEVPFDLNELEIFLEKLFSSENILDRLIGVFLATGRRSIEILGKGFFSESQQANHLSMKGIAKKKEKESEVHFPVLWDSEEILKTISESREENISYVLLRNYLIQNYSKNLKSLHDLRKLYGVYSYLLFSNQKTHFNLWLNEVLGHEEENISTSFHYSEYQIPFHKE